MKLNEFRTLKMKEYNTLRENNEHLFPINLKDSNNEFDLVEGDECIAINGEDVTIEDMQGEPMEIEVYDLNIEDVCYVVELVQDAVDEFEKTMERTRN